MEDWDLDENGEVIARPVVSFGTAVPFGMACLLRVEYISSEAQIGKKPHAVQLVLTPQKARDLSRLLLAVAEKAEELPRSDEIPN